LDALLDSSPTGSSELFVRSGQVAAGPENLIAVGPESGSGLPVARLGGGYRRAAVADGLGELPLSEPDGNAPGCQ